MEMAVSNVSFLPMHRYLFHYAFIHALFFGVLMLHFGMEKGPLGYLTLAVIGAFMLFFYIRPDYVLPIYRIHKRLMTESGVRTSDSVVAYLMKRILAWIFVATWFPLFVLFGGQLASVAKIYVLLFCAFLTFYFSDYLFASYKTYALRVAKGEWMRLKRYWVPRHSVH